jgi:hypothetical protein
VGDAPPEGAAGAGPANDGAEHAGQDEAAPTEAQLPAEVRAESGAPPSHDAEVPANGADHAGAGEAAPPASEQEPEANNPA